jgi:hypothetical protein
VDTRPRGKQPLNVWVTPGERAQIQQLAATTGMSVSAFLRSLGLGYQPKSKADSEHVRQLLAACGNLGRLGGLLKLWLVEKPGQGVPENDVRRLLNQIGDLRLAIVDKVAGL